MEALRRTFFVSALFASLSGFGVTTYTASVNGITWTYTITNGYASVGVGSSLSTAVPGSTSGVITIPSNLGGYTVTSIGDYAFYCCSGLKSVTIPDSVTSIGDGAFYCCSGLTSVTIPDSVTIIGNWAFSYCSRLTSVTIPDSVTSIGDFAFYGCSGLASVTIPNSVTNIGSEAFSMCSGLMEILVGVGNGKYSSDNGFLLSKDGKILIQGVNGHVVIPYSVTNIGAFAFHGCSGLTSVTIPDSVTSIGRNAFSSCSGLTSVTIPDSVTRIGEFVFYNCSGLMSVTIPDSVTSIGDHAFNCCSGLTSVTIPDSVTSIGDHAFSGCVGLADADGFVIVCNILFDYVGAGGDVSIPDTVYDIGRGAFYGCGTITSLTIPDSVVNIGDGMFDGDYNQPRALRSVIIGHSVTNIGNYAFNNCHELYDITMSDSVTRIGNLAFSGCSSVLSVLIPPNVERIGDYAFAWCSNLQSVLFLGNAPCEMGDEVFSSTSCNIYVFENSTGWNIKIPGKWNGRQLKYMYEYIVDFNANGGTVEEASRRVLDIGGARLGDLPLPQLDGYRFVGWFTEEDGGVGVNANTVVRNDMTVYAHWVKTSKVVFDANGGVGGWCWEMDVGRNIVVPTVTRDGYTLTGWLPEVAATVPDSNVTYTAQWEINKYTVTFDANGGAGGTSLLVEYGVNLPVPDAPMREKYNFAGWFTKPEGGTQIGEGAVVTSDMILYAHWELKSNVWLYDVVDDMAVITGYSSPVGELEMPSDIDGYSVAAIASNAFVNCTNMTSIVIPGCVTNVGTRAFYGCSGLTSVTIPDSVTGIGDRAFYGCSGLTSVTIPDSVTSIGSYAFYWCTNLTSAAIGNGVTNIGSYAFSGCSGLTSVTIPQCVCASRLSYVFPDSYSSITNVVVADGVETISANAFDGCSGLISVTMPTSVTSVGGYAFRDCASLLDVTIPQSVTSMGAWAFNRCTSLTNATILGNVTIIGGYSFSGCSSLESVKIPSGVKVMGANVFSGCEQLKTIFFEGNAPTTVASNAFDNVSRSCNVIVMYRSSGWGTQMPGVWKGLPIDYLRYDVFLDANGGQCSVTNISVPVGSAIGTLPVPTYGDSLFLGWFSEREGGVKLDESTVVVSDMTLYAHWLHSVDAPVIVPSGENPFTADSCTVTMSCATEGATIYYTDDGTTPKINEAYRYTGPIVITDTTLFKAVAACGDLRSEYVLATITKKLLTLEEALDVVAGVALGTSEAMAWCPIIDANAKVGESVACSGAIGDRTNTWLSATVEGAGTMTFWCKVSCEHDEDDTFTWDRLMVYTNDVEIVEWRMDGNTDWTERSLSFDDGSNTVKWVYYKDRIGSEGEDCAWVDAVVWMPSGAIPAVAADATPGAVTNAIETAGFADAAAVKAAIGGSAAEYNAFKAWAESVKNVVGSEKAGEAAVVASPHAAVAYLLGAERLFANDPIVEIAEMAIGNGTSGTGGASGTENRGTMTVAVKVKDGDTAVAVDAEKVAAMFEATGDLGDWNGAAKLTPTVTAEAGDGATMRFKVTPGDGTAPRAFLRIRK